MTFRRMWGKFDMGGDCKAKYGSLLAKPYNLQGNVLETALTAGLSQTVSSYKGWPLQELQGAAWRDAVCADSPALAVPYLSLLQKQNPLKDSRAVTHPSFPLFQVTRAPWPATGGWRASCWSCRLSAQPHRAAQLPTGLPRNVLWWRSSSSTWMKTGMGTSAARSWRRWVLCWVQMEWVVFLILERRGWLCHSGGSGDAAAPTSASASPVWCPTLGDPPQQQHGSFPASSLLLRLADNPHC